MRPPSTGVFGGAPYGPRSAVLGVADACTPPILDLRWSSLWGHEMLCWVWGTHAPPFFLRWGLPWSSLWGHEALCWVWQTHAGCVIRPSVGLPSYGATNITRRASWQAVAGSLRVIPGRWRASWQ
eukprot:4695857-Pyramimonas_sp.AAC.1